MPKTIEINDKDSFIFIRFENFGSAQFGIDMNVSPTQIFAAVGFLNKHAEIGLMEQIAQAVQAREQNKIMTPDKMVVGKP